MAKRTIKINLKLPAGVVATEELERKVTKAAKAVIDALSGELALAQKTARELSKQGFKLTAEDLLKSKVGKKVNSSSKTPAKKAARKRVVLNDAQKAALVEDLKKGMKANAVAAKHGVSTATVNKLKTAVGLTRKKKKSS